MFYLEKLVSKMRILTEHQGYVNITDSEVICMKEDLIETEEIEMPCRECHGFGSIKQYCLSHYHDFEEVEVGCSGCDGSGVVVIERLVERRGR